MISEIKEIFSLLLDLYKSNNISQMFLKEQER